MWAAAVALWIVTRLPAVPLMFQLVSVVVVPAVKLNVVGETPLARVVNVLLPVMVSAPAPLLVSVQLKVEPPPTKVLAVAAVMRISPEPVPAVVVKLVGTALLNAVVEAAGQVRKPPLNVMFFVPAAVAYEVPTVSVLPLRSRVPFVWVNVRVDPISKESASLKVPPTPLCVIGKSIVLPFVVIT